MGLRALLKRSQDEVRKAEEERGDAEEALVRQKQRDNAKKERMGRQIDTAVTVGVSGATAVGTRAIRKRVNMKPGGIDLGGVAAAAAFVGAVVQAGKKYGATVAGVASGLACEYALNKMDPAQPVKSQSTAGLEDGEETGDVDELPPARRRLSLRERLARSRGAEGDRVDARDVIDMPQG
ncbi:MAG TPA: hypothetical protein VLS89_14850 [Candidatus Nanopelagicales bacterium]|nr:hypothetical protein [Candidatus Nanopelagicales bacterium]